MLIFLLLLPPVHAQTGGGSWVLDHYACSGATTIGGNTPFTWPASVAPGTFYNQNGTSQSVAGSGVGFGTNNNNFVPMKVTGTIGAVFVWRGSGGAPAGSVNIIFLADGEGMHGSANAADGFNDPVAFIANTIYRSEGTHVVNVPVSAGEKTFTVGPPSALLGYDPNGSYDAEVSLTASVVDMSLPGTTPDASGKANILVGQGCSASLSGIPTALLNNTAHPPTYVWKVSGISFQQWNSSTPQVGTTPANPNASYFVGGYGPSTNSTAHWYWNDPNNTTENVTCTVTLTPSAGQGSTFTVTATKTVAVQLPGVQATGQGGYMQINTDAPNVNGTLCLYAGGSPQGALGGMNFTARSFTPQTPAFGTGTLKLVQLIKPYVGYSTALVPGTTNLDPKHGQNGLDTSCPYPGSTYTEGTATLPYTTNDSPTLPLTSYMEVVTMQHQFTDTLMYVPPGTDIQWVPLGTFSWSTNGNATQPSTGNWADYAAQHGGGDGAGTVNPTAVTPFTLGNTFPSWTQINGSESLPFPAS